MSRGTSICGGDSVVSLDEDLARRCDAGLAVASTEEFVVEQLSTARGDKLAGKLRSRIAAMAKKDVDPGKIQESIWAKGSSVHWVIAQSRACL